MKIALRPAAICALILVSGSASAQGWFAGGAVGQAKQQDYQIGQPIRSFDETDGAYRVFGGFLVSPMQGVVVSHINLGTAYYAGPVIGGSTDSSEAEGYDFSYIIGWAPGSQERISVFGTLGIFAWDQYVLLTDPTGSFRYVDDGASFSVGLGAEFRLGAAGASPWGIHMEWQLFKDVGEDSNSGNEFDREMLSVGVSYRFGGSYRRD